MDRKGDQRGRSSAYNQAVVLGGRICLSGGAEPSVEPKFLGSKLSVDLLFLHPKKKTKTIQIKSFTKSYDVTYLT